MLQCITIFKKIILLVALTILMQSCSGIKMLSMEDIYPPEFLKKIEGIQTIYRDGDKQGAIDKLLAMDDKTLSGDEKAKKYNLLGVFTFSRAEFNQSLEYFDVAREYVDKDRALQAQIYLNMASTNYKQLEYKNAYERLFDVEVEALAESEEEKFYLLKYVLASQLNETKEIVIALINLMKKSDSFDDIHNSKYKEALLDNYRQLTASERVYILEKNDDKKNLVTAYLAKNEVQQRYYMGDKNGARDVLVWLDNKYGNHEEVKEFIKDFNFRMENFSKINVGAIGVVLPLSGKNAKYGKRTLMGIESAINMESNKEYNLKIHTKDNHNNPFVAKQMVHDLIQTYHVSMIIGGLFPQTAKDEYLEARKYGVLFISLSPVYVAKEFKSHLLLEVSGSVQSQLATLMDEKVLAKFGSKVGLFYPKEERGYTYVDEIWNQYRGSKIKVNGIQGFEKNKTQYLEPVKKMLGLKYHRERLEELLMVKEIHELERKQQKSSVRRTQHLEPVIDFDWVFVPSYPHEAVQIIPAFKYFDAAKVTFIGGPSWLSKKLLKEQRKSFGRVVYFVGDDPKDFDRSFVDYYKQRNSRSPRLMEIKGFEAMNLSYKIIAGTKMEKRDELEGRLVNLKRLEGVTGNWNLVEGIWLKEMDFLKVSRGKLEKVDLTIEEPKEESKENKSN
jgi:hypothetical protein